MALIEFKNKPNTDTPINDVNLNYNFNELNNLINEKNIMTIFLQDINPASVGAWEVYSIPNYVLNNKIGDKLIFNNGIKIGAGVTKIKVSADITIHNNNENNSDFNFLVRKNNDTVASTYDTASANLWLENTIPTYLINVKENDVISLGILCGLAGSYRIYRGTLTVEVVR